MLLYLLNHLPPLSMTFSPGWTWTNCFSIHQKLNFFSLAQTTASQIFWSNKLISQQWYHPSQFLCSQSWASSLTLTCLSLIKSTLYPNLVIFTSETSVEFVIFFLSLQPQLLPNSLVSSKLDYCNSLYSGISQTNLNKLQRIQNSLARVITNTSKYQHITPTLKKLHWLPIKQRSITKSVFSHTKHLQINNLHIFTIVFHFRHILFLRDLLIHLFFPFHMSDHHLAKGLSLSSVHDSGIHSLLILETRLLYQYSVPDSKHTSSKLRSLPRLFPISLDCLPGFLILCPIEWHLVLDTGL